MFCRNCGEQYRTDEAVLCVKCGTPKGQGANFCPNCGKPVHPDCTVCMNCGVALKHVAMYKQKSKMVAGLLAIFLGAFGIHNFYLGYTNKAIVQLVCTIVGMLLSCLVIGAFVVFGMQIWAIVEGVMILTGKIEVDGKGTPLTE